MHSFRGAFLGIFSLAAIIVQIYANPLAIREDSASLLSSELQARDPASSAVVGERKLHGRFLHITDFHPDPFYKLHSSTAQDAACHRGSGPAGTYGAETSDCDSPITLINATFDWIAANIRDSIDFIVWTGDSARHDNDEKIPRTKKQVLDLNQFMVNKFIEVFSNQSKNNSGNGNDLVVPIVPTFGNNDIMPHNIMLSGPNFFTEKFLGIWRPFIPEAQRHGFERGGWFYVEVIPQKLAVFSLNTLYFFDSNSAVDGCAETNQPGYEQMEWLRIQLQFLRQRKMKAILTGHVPPARTTNKMSWDETCWQKYTIWLRQYRDVIVGSLYGHMNIDHFLLQDNHDIDVVVADGLVEDEEDDDAGDKVNLMSADNYLADLREEWAKIPDPPESNSMWSKMIENLHLSQAVLGNKQASQRYEREISYSSKAIQNSREIIDPSKKKKHSKDVGGKWNERYSLSLIAPSIVPNYFPSLRIIEYNISRLGDIAAGSLTSQQPSLDLVEEISSNPPSTPDTFFASAIEELKKKKHKKHKKPSKYPKFIIPDPPSKTSPPGPAYSPQMFTLLGYTQYFANLTHINNDLQGIGTDDLDLQSRNSSLPVDLLRWHPGKHKDKHPHEKYPNPNPKPFKFEVEYSTFNDTGFGLTDLTVRSYVNLARRIAKAKPEDDDFSILSEEYPDFEDLEDVEGDATVTKKKHKKGKGKGKRRHSHNEAWFTFVKRAFVRSKSDNDLHELFG